MRIDERNGQRARTDGGCERGEIILKGRVERHWPADAAKRKSDAEDFLRQRELTQYSNRFLAEEGVLATLSQLASLRHVSAGQGVISRGSAASTLVALRTGEVALGLRTARDVPMREVVAAEAVAGKGLLGDRYASASGKRGITLIQAEHLPAIAALAGLQSVVPATLRRNLVVSGLPLVALNSSAVTSLAQAAGKSVGLPSQAASSRRSAGAASPGAPASRMPRPPITSRTRRRC